MNILSKIAPDKLQHLKAGFLASLFGVFIGAVTGAAVAKFGPWVVPMHLAAAFTAIPCAIVSAASAGLTKEQADKMDNEVSPGMHEVSWRDAAFTAAGSIPIVAALLLAVANLK